MVAVWKTRYGVDASNVKSLCSLRDPGGKGFGLPSKRIVLLWSLYSQIQQFDHQLLALLNMTRAHDAEANQRDSELASVGFKPSACEAARLLKVQGVIAKLVRMKGSSDTRGLADLELELQEAVLAGGGNKNDVIGKHQRHGIFSGFCAPANPVALGGRYRG